MASCGWGTATHGCNTFLSTLPYPRVLCWGSFSKSSKGRLQLCKLEPSAPECLWLLCAPARCHLGIFFSLIMPKCGLFSTLLLSQRLRSNAAGSSLKPALPHFPSLWPPWLQPTLNLLAEGSDCIHGAFVPEWTDQHQFLWSNYPIPGKFIWIGESQVSKKSLSQRKGNSPGFGIVRVEKLKRNQQYALSLC